MKKQYQTPRCLLHRVRNAEVIITSEIPLGADVEQGHAEAPPYRQGSDWEDYNS